MSYKNLIIPIGTALAGLIAATAEASTVPVDSQRNSPELQDATKTAKDLRDPLIKQLLYQMEGQTYALNLHKSSSEVLYAAHGSHVSHRSHRSGR